MDLIPERTLLEVKYIPIADSEIEVIQNFSVFFSIDNEYIKVTMHDLQESKEFMSVNLPLLFSPNASKVFKVSDFSQLRVIGNLTDIPAQFLICHKLESYTSIKENRLYATINSVKGKDFTFLRYDVNKNEISFLVDDRILSGDSKKLELEETYSLKRENVYEVWEVRALIYIDDSYYRKDSVHLLYDTNELESSIDGV